MSIAVLDEPCSQHFTPRELIGCGATMARLVPGCARAEAAIPAQFLPQESETWAAMKRLARELLDPVANQVGRPELTYGFSGPALARQIRRGIAPRLDQHAGHERRRDGRLICPRGGQAVDLIVPGLSSLQLAIWLIEHTPVDRLYFYGEERPVHVSVGPEESRSAWWLRPLEGGRTIPTPLARYEPGAASTGP